MFAEFTGKHLCQGLYFNKVTGLWYRCFPVNFAKFLRTPFLQITSGRLLLLLAFQKQPPEVFYEKSVLENFRKFTGKHLWFAKFSKTHFLQNTSGRVLLAFSCNITKTGYCQHCSENLMNIHYLETLTLEVPFRYIISFLSRINFQCMPLLLYTVYSQKQPSE